MVLGDGGDEGGRTLYSYLQPYIADKLLELLDKKWNPTGRWDIVSWYYGD